MALKTVEGRSAVRRSRPSDSVARQTDASDIAPHRHLANVRPFLFDSRGCFLGFVTGRAEARALVREGV
ncbi:hypothetical protein FOHLNKBM_3618 [Methylobacterium longum]|nr:hypothetical protein FOHLNKBM_3618 [Methylobacterium longum]